MGLKRTPNTKRDPATQKRHRAVGTNRFAVDIVVMFTERVVRMVHEYVNI